MTTEADRSKGGSPRESSKGGSSGLAKEVAKAAKDVGLSDEQASEIARNVARAKLSEEVPLAQVILKAAQDVGVSEENAAAMVTKVEEACKLNPGIIAKKTQVDRALAVVKAAKETEWMTDGYGYMIATGVLTFGWLYFSNLADKVEWCRPRGHANCIIQSSFLFRQMMWVIVMACVSCNFWYKYCERKAYQAWRIARDVKRASLAAQQDSKDGAESSSSNEDDPYDYAYGDSTDTADPDLSLPLGTVCVLYFILCLSQLIEPNEGVQLNPGYVKASRFFSTLILMLLGPFYVYEYYRNGQDDKGKVGAAAVDAIVVDEAYWQKQFKDYKSQGGDLDWSAWMATQQQAYGAPAAEGAAGAASSNSAAPAPEKAPTPRVSTSAAPEAAPAPSSEAPAAS